MRAIIDGDILRYEIGFAAETGWRAITEDDEALPPFEYVRDMLQQRIAAIMVTTGSDRYTLYVTEGHTFRYDIATVKPYKGTRKENKPWHYNNLSVYMKDILGCHIVTLIEADDAMAIDHLNSGDDTIICSRDKDLRQIPGWSYSWELGNQPAFGPEEVDPFGWIELSDNRKKINGTGTLFFCSQMLVGDAVDNIPGLPKCGPVAAYDALHKCSDAEEAITRVLDMYRTRYDDTYMERALEQGRLLWLLRDPIVEGKDIPLWTPEILYE